MVSRCFAPAFLSHVPPSGAHVRKLLHAYVYGGNEGTCEHVHASACNCLRLLASDLCRRQRKIEGEGEVRMRPEKERTISYRITEKAWSEIVKRAATAGESPHQWARSALLEKLNRNGELMPAEIGRAS